MATADTNQGIFISYRREDSRADAGRLYDRLAAEFGEQHVFMDIDDISPGDRFMEVLRTTLGDCRVVIALIGPSWLAASASDGPSHLHSEHDVLRMELRTALERDITVIPVLINRASMPEPASLPQDISALADHQAIELSDQRFHQDVDELCGVLRQLIVGSTKRGARRHWVLGGVAALCLVAAVVWLTAGTWMGVQPRARSQAATLSSAEIQAMLLDLQLYDAQWHPTGSGPNHDYSLQVLGKQGVVVDRSTRLMWQLRASRPQSPLLQAHELLAALNRDRLGGFADWRLPTAEEAAALLTPGTTAGYHMAAVLAPADTPFFWTSDLHPNGKAWVLYAYDGMMRPEPVAFNAWLRAVRSMD